MNSEQYLYEEFIRLCKSLNAHFHITPVLYGSLGLGKSTRRNFSPQDIDILVPFVYLNEQWDMLQQLMVQLGYSLTDLREHEFCNRGIQVGFAFMEDLEGFAEIDYRSLETMQDGEAEYFVLSVDDYLKVYAKSSVDGYRRTKNHGKDLTKLAFLRSISKIQ